jgi:choline dehydrogenase-like flavoprotein
VITSLNDFEDGALFEADVCVVGGGPAGISLANALAGTKLSVILLESGGHTFSEEAQDLNEGRTIDGIPPMGLGQSRLRYFGGTSNHWGGDCGPLDPIDFETRTWIPRSGWPLDQQHLAAHYEKAGRVIGLSRHDQAPDLHIGEQPGLFGFAGTDVVHKVRERKRTLFGQAYQEALGAAPKVRVLLNTSLIQVAWTEGSRAVSSLAIGSLAGRRATLKARAYVLACGGVENARVLLNADVSKRLDYVGRCFAYHPRLVSGVILLERPLFLGADYYRFRETGSAVTGVTLGLSAAAQRREHLPNHAAYLARWNLPAAWRLLGEKKKARGMHFEAFSEDLRVLHRELRNKSGATGSAMHSDLMTVTTWLEEVPNPESRVTLDDPVDALGVRRVQLRWSQLDQERRWLQRFNELIARAVGAAGVGRMKIADRLEDESIFRDRIRAAGFTGGGGHQMGTTRMSVSPKDGVVDADCRVHGVGNLYCAGSSVFPTASWMNPTLTLVALALRLADHLRVDLGA